MLQAYAVSNDIIAFLRGKHEVKGVCFVPPAELQADHRLAEVAAAMPALLSHHYALPEYRRIVEEVVPSSLRSSSSTRQFTRAGSTVEDADARAVVERGLGDGAQVGQLAHAVPQGARARVAQLQVHRRDRGAALSHCRRHLRNRPVPDLVPIHEGVLTSFAS